MKYKEIIELININIPVAYKQLLNGHGENKIAFFECDSTNELHLMKIHYENAKHSGLNILGIEELIEKLIKFQSKVVFLVNARNDDYFFKFYFEQSLQNFLVCVVIKLRKKTEEEILWGREVLGIKKSPPKI